MEPDQAMLFIVCGLPFAGKTTMSTGLARQMPNAVHIEIDRINTERGLGINAAPISAVEWAETYRLAYERVDNALAAGNTVILDAANYSRAQRDVLRMHARRHGTESAVLYVDVPVIECRQRWLKNRSSRERYDVRDEDFTNVVEKFDPPRADERVILFMPGMAVEDLLTGIKQLQGDG